jgi:hypothetical protein
MARFKDGLLGAFSGRAGNIVGSTWRRIRVVKAAGPSTRVNDSPAQVVQQARFSLAFRFVRTMSDLFGFTFKNFADEMTPQNYAMKLVVNEAVTGDYPNFSIDYSMVRISQGSLKPEKKQSIALSVAAGILTWRWNFVQKTFGPLATDKTILVAYCPALDELEAVDLGPDRSTNTATLNVTSFVGQTVETWIAFMSADKKKFSDSVYTGQIAVV